MTRVAVLPNDHHDLAAEDYDLRISLFDRRGEDVFGRVGSSVPKRFVRRMGRTAPAVAWDLTALAMAVVAADRAVSRYRTSPDGWTREIDLTVAVTTPELWNAAADRWAEVLRFLTGDLWTIRFEGNGIYPVEPRRRVRERPETCVSLLSGGLDSLIGALDLAAAGDVPVFVSHVVRGDRARQTDIARTIGRGATLLQLNHDARTDGTPEISQRSRSIAFIAFGVLAASVLDRYQAGDRVELHIPENGFISLNVPLTPLRTGSLSTRTTHPSFIRKLQSLLDDLGFRVNLVNRYALKTKGEMLEECADQDRLEQLAFDTMSCGRGGRHYTHCGRCLPCLVRRGAFLRWTGRLDADDTQYMNFQDPAHPVGLAGFAAYDDVMQARTAMRRVREKGRDRWIGPAITSAHVDDPEPYRAVAARGLEEIGSFLQAAGIP